MARQRMSNKNTKKYREKLNLPIDHILNTNHRKDLCLKVCSRMEIWGKAIWDRWFCCSMI